MVHYWVYHITVILLQNHPDKKTNKKSAQRRLHLAKPVQGGGNRVELYTSATLSWPGHDGEAIHDKPLRSIGSIWAFDHRLHQQISPMVPHHFRLADLFGAPGHPTIIGNRSDAMPIPRKKRCFIIYVYLNLYNPSLVFWPHQHDDEVQKLYCIISCTYRLHIQLYRLI